MVAGIFRLRVNKKSRVSQTDLSPAWIPKPFPRVHNLGHRHILVHWGHPKDCTIEGNAQIGHRKFCAVDFFIAPGGVYTNLLTANT
jgi:hypothetical protein